MDLKHIHSDDVTSEGVRIPHFIIKICLTQRPAHKWQYLNEIYPEIVPYATETGLIPLDVIKALPEP